MSKESYRPFLKNCPFCGGRAELIKTSNGYAHGDNAITDSFMVCCDHCSAKTEIRGSDVRMNDYGLIEVKKNGAEEVINLWNRRTDADLVEYPESNGK